MNKSCQLLPTPSIKSSHQKVTKSCQLLPTPPNKSSHQKVHKSCQLLPTPSNKSSHQKLRKSCQLLPTPSIKISPQKANKTCQVVPIRIRTTSDAQLKIRLLRKIISSTILSLALYLYKNYQGRGNWVSSPKEKDAALAAASRAGRGKWSDTGMGARVIAQAKP